MLKPLVTVVTPAWNIERFLRSTVRSVLNQTFERFSYLIIDDGSTDRTNAIAHEFAKGDSRIRVIKKTHGGLTSVRNLGIRTAQTEYVAFVDGDDLWTPQFLEKSYEQLRRLGPKCCGTFCRSAVINEQGRNIGRYIQVPVGKCDLVRTMLWHCPPGNGSSLLLKKSVFTRAGFFSEKWLRFEDTEMWHRMLSKIEGGFLYGLPDIMVKYRCRNGSLSKTVRVHERMMFFRHLLRKYIARCDTQTQISVYYMFAGLAALDGDERFALELLTKAATTDMEFFYSR